MFQKYGILLKWSSKPESILAIGDWKTTNEVVLHMIQKDATGHFGSKVRFCNENYSAWKVYDLSNGCRNIEPSKWTEKQISTCT